MADESNKNLMNLGELTDTRQSNLNINNSTNINGDKNINESINQPKLSNNAMKLKSLEDKMLNIEVNKY
jgi:hypothetical protein